jgi:hypothetical protein
MANNAGEVNKQQTEIKLCYRGLFVRRGGKIGTNTISNVTNVKSSLRKSCTLSSQEIPRPIMALQGPLSCLQDPTIEFCTELDESNLTSCLSKFHFNIILLSTTRSRQNFLPFRYSD